MDDGANTLKGPSRTRTGEFDEPFAQNANKQRWKRQPIQLAPRLRPRPTFASQNARNWSWCHIRRTKSHDNENPEERDEFYVSHRLVHPEAFVVWGINWHDRVGQFKMYLIFKFLVTVSHLEAENRSCFLPRGSLSLLPGQEIYAGCR